MCLTRGAACWFCLVLSVVAAEPDRRGPFNQPPRSVRSRDFDVRHIRLELKPDLAAQRLDGRVAHTLTPFKPLSRIVLDARELVFDGVRVSTSDGSAGGTPVQWQTQPEGVEITLDRTYQPDETLVVTLDYHLTRPARGAHFVVPDPREPEQARLLWTQSEPETARYWFPCFDSPTDRCTSEVLVTAPAEMFVLSNGVLRGKQLEADGRQTWHWFQEQPHVTYLMTAVVGDFVAWEQNWDGIPIQSYVPPQRLADAERTFANMPAMLEFFSTRLKYRYPWPKYAQICCDEYDGGMEHTSATTLTLRVLHDARSHPDVQPRAENLLAHELAHQWFGDLVTCKDWAEIWLNESFATYFATLWREHSQGADEATWARHLEAETYFAEDRDLHRRPLVTYQYPSADSMFDRHSYPKGARILHMLRYVLGDELFWKTLHHYLQRHALRTVETADLRTAVEDATGGGLNWFFDEWLNHGGHPEFVVSTRWDEGLHQLTLHVRQVQHVDDLTPLFTMPVEISLTTAEGTELKQIRVSQADEQFHFSLDQRPLLISFDPHDWILKTLDFAKSREELLRQLVSPEHLIPRVQAVRALTDYPTDEIVRAALIQAATADPFWAVREQALVALRSFTGPEVREVCERLCRSDPHSIVRRAALMGLANFTEPSSAAVVRAAIAEDPSYFVIADALRTLAKVDRAGAAPDLFAALALPSHEDVILKGACDGLAELAHPDAPGRLLGLLEPPASPDRRAAVLDALARLADERHPELLDRAGEQLTDERRYVRIAAAEALARSANPAAGIQLLLARRKIETERRVLRAIDAALVELRKRQTGGDLPREVERLRAQQQTLEERLKQLEAAGDP